MQRQTGTLLDAASKPAAGCAITVVHTAGGAAAALWSDNGITPVGSNIVTTNARGFYSFYARNGVYSLQPAKTGHSFVNSDLDTVTLFDPRDDGHPATEGGRGVLLDCDFHSLFNLATQVSVSGGALLQFPNPRQAALKTPTSTFRNGWLECVSDGTAQPNTPYFGFEESGTPATRAWGYVPTAPEQLIIETAMVLVGSHASAIRRFGLASAGLQVTADPADGIYLAQGHTSPMVLVTRNASSQTLTSFLPGGLTLDTATPVQFRFVITASLVQVFATLAGSLRVATCATTIPATSTLLYLLAGSTQPTAGVGFAVDYVRAMVNRA